MKSNVSVAFAAEMDYPRNLGRLELPWASEYLSCISHWKFQPFSANFTAANWVQNFWLCASLSARATSQWDTKGNSQHLISDSFTVKMLAFYLQTCIKRGTFKVLHLQPILGNHCVEAPEPGNPTKHDNAARRAHAIVPIPCWGFKLAPPWEAAIPRSAPAYDQWSEIQLHSKRTSEGQEQLNRLLNKLAVPLMVSSSHMLPQKKKQSKVNVRSSKKHLQFATICYCYISSWPCVAAGPLPAMPLKWPHQCPPLSLPVPPSQRRSLGWICGQWGHQSAVSTCCPLRILAYFDCIAWAHEPISS